MLCKYCGIEFEPKKLGRKNGGFCGKKCADNYRYYNSAPKYKSICEWCGRVFTTNNKHQKFCSRECTGLSKRGRTEYEKACEYCGTTFRTIDPKVKYCSSTCGSRKHADDIRGEYFCEFCGKPRYSDHPNRNRFCSKECAIKHKAELFTPIKLERQRQREEALHKVCPNCGKEFRAKQLNQKYCSPECVYDYHLRLMREEWEANFVPKEFICRECGKPVKTVVGRPRSVYCSDECSNRAQGREYKHNRKEQMDKAFVEPVSLKTVYARVAGVCEICGLPVLKTTEPTNIWAATMDHIKPLSVGGLHENANCQLAHRLCNSIKGQAAEEFRIDWRQKASNEPERWAEAVNDLWRQLEDEI